MKLVIFSNKRFTPTLIYGEQVSNTDSKPANMVKKPVLHLKGEGGPNI
jgi:hypothetical protein